MKYELNISYTCAVFIHFDCPDSDTSIIKLYTHDRVIFKRSGDGECQRCHIAGTMDDRMTSIDKTLCGGLVVG